MYSKVFKEDGNTSGWSGVWSVSTLITVEEPQILIKEATEPEPSMENRTNLNSFLSLTTLLSNAVLLTSTTGPF